MPERRRLGRLGRRLTSAFLLVSLVALAVLFVGTIVPHVVEQHTDPHDDLSLTWLLAATLVAVVTAVVASVVLAARLTRPIDGYIDAARRFATGDRSARPPDDGPSELADLTVALQFAANEIERSEQERNRLTADIAHELRTPLTALQAGLEELRDGLMPADQTTLAALHDQATRMGRVIEDLSTLAAADSAELRLHRRDVDLAQIAALAVAARRGTLDVAGLTVELDARPGVRVLADGDRVHQMVGNLLANAAQYCRPGDHVTVRARRDHDDGVLEVADTGPGFAAEDLPHVFERTWRATGAAPARGSGLGLPIVRALATAHGGTADITSVQGEGSTVTIRLPCTSATAPGQAFPHRRAGVI